MHLYIANKCYSSWSLRAWMLLRAFSVAFAETIIPLDEPETSKRIKEVSAAGRVPILTDGEIKVWESLAIAEYVYEKFPDKQVWPADTAARAHARAVSSEMHAGFMALRAACPMNLGKRYSQKDRGADVAADVARIEDIWAEARNQFVNPAAGPFLYGAFTAADAMYAPVVSRLETYSFDVRADTRAYMEAVLNHSAFIAWRDAGLRESWIVPSDEVDEEPFENLRPHIM